VTRGKNLLRRLIGAPLGGEAARPANWRSRDARPGREGRDWGRGGRRGRGKGRAMTIHQVKGLRMIRATIDIGSDVYAHGKAYLALSRVHSLEGVLLSNISEAPLGLIDPLVF
jgi:hypothetical protein